MAYIITSKTRAKIMRQPVERAKALSDRRAMTQEKHRVFNVTPTLPVSEEEIHAELDKQGQSIAEAMIANQEITREKTKKRKENEQAVRQKIIKERLEKLKQRDQRSGVADRVRSIKSKKER